MNPINCSLFDKQLLKFRTRMSKDFWFHMMDKYNKGVLDKVLVVVVADCVFNFICMKYDENKTTKYGFSDEEQAMCK